jgi:2-formylbenzoate dehydrogenase
MDGVDLREARHESAGDLLGRHPWRMLIGGELVPSRSGRRYQTVDPSTEQPLAEVPDAGAEDVDAAVRAAREGFPAWRALSAWERGRLVRRLAGVLLENETELATLDALDLGSPLASMRLDVARAAESLELFANWALDLGGDVVPASARNLHYTLREPYGVVARILPYNHPIMFAAGKIAAPLVAGNAVIVKPAHQSPLSALRMGELFNEVLPPGVLNIVTGSGPDTGRAIAEHPRIPRIAFIGSEATGRAIQRSAAVSVKHVTLELGGKNAMVVFEDTDLEAAAAGAVAGMNLGPSTGQSCGSTSRLLVQRGIAEELVSRVYRRMAAIRVGRALDPETGMGPLVSAAQQDKVLGYVRSARSDGARVALGGDRPEHLSHG